VRASKIRQRKYAPYLVSGIVFPHPRKILFEGLLVEGRLAHVYDLHWLAMLACTLVSCNMNRNKAEAHMRLSRSGDLNTASVKDFLVEDDDGGMPRKESEGRVRSLASLVRPRKNKDTYHIPSICLPTSCVDIALTMPLLISYTYNFTGEDMVVTGVVLLRGRVRCYYILLYMRTRMCR